MGRSTRTSSILIEMKNDKICIVVPCYNVENYLARCIESIQNQTVKDFALLLVDDGATDSTGEICEKYAASDSRIKVFHKANGGQGSARNLALDWAYAHLDFGWVTFVDSDDWVHERYLEILLEAAKKNCVKISSCGYIGSQGQEKDAPIDRVDEEIESAEELISHHKHSEFNFGVPWGRLFEKSLFETLRYPEDRYFEDGFTIFKALFSVEKIALCKVGLYYWFNNPQSTIRVKLSEKKINDFIDAMVCQMDYFQSNGFEKAYRHEVGVFFYRLLSHLRENAKDRQLKAVNKKYIQTAKRIVKSDRKRYNYSNFSDLYAVIYSPLYCAFCKLRSKITGK